MTQHFKRFDPNFTAYENICIFFVFISSPSHHNTEEENVDNWLCQSFDGKIIIFSCFIKKNTFMALVELKAV